MIDLLGVTLIVTRALEACGIPYELAENADKLNLELRTWN